MALNGFSIPNQFTDDAGNLLFGATADVTGPNSYVGSVTSDALTGIFRLGPVPPGDYTVTRGGRSVVIPVLPASTEILASVEIDLIRQLTQAEYDALTTKDARTLYVII